MAGRDQHEASHNLHDVQDERRAATLAQVEQMRVRVDHFETNRRVRLLSAKFNRVQYEVAQKAVARSHWLLGVKRAAGLDFTTRGGDGQPKSQHPSSSTPASQLGERAYAALETARHAPWNDTSSFLEAEELFFQGCEAMGKSRDEVRAEIEAEQAAAARNVTLAVLRWRRACTMVQTMLAIDRQNAEKVKLFADEMIAQYTSIEPHVTRIVGDHTINAKGRLIGLEYRLKSASSLFRKIMSDMDEERTKPDGMTLLQVCEHCYDILRYTCVLETSEYVEGTKAILKALDGCTNGEMKTSQFRVKNFWGKGDAYQGINSVYSLQRGGADPLYFELQFHTPESIKTKEETCHVSYENFRTAVDQEEKAVAWEEMVSVWDLVPVPRGVLDIPKIFNQAFEHDMSNMTELEKHLIAHRKKLESRCSEIVSEVHARALQAEPALTTLIQHLVVKHGHEPLHQSYNVKLRDHDKRLMGELAIRREAVQMLSRQYYPSRFRDEDGDVLIRYSAGGEPPPPVGGHIIFGGAIDDMLVHQVVFGQVQRAPPLTYCIEVCHEIYFAFAVQDIITDTQAASDVELLSVYNWFGEPSSRHRGIEATFRHLYTGMHFLLVFHTPASYRQSVDLRKAMVEMKRPAAGKSSGDLDEQFRRHCALSALCNDVTVPPRCLTIGEVRYSAVPARGDGTHRFQPSERAVAGMQQHQPQLTLHPEVTAAQYASGNGERPGQLPLQSSSFRPQRDRSSPQPLQSSSFRPRRDPSSPQPLQSSSVSPRDAECSQRRDTANSSGQQSTLVEAVTAAVQTAVAAEIDGLRKMLAQQQQATQSGTTGYSRQVESIAMQHGISLPPRMYAAGAMRPAASVSASASSASHDVDASATLSLSARRRKHRLQALDSHDDGNGSPLRAKLQEMKLSAIRKRALGLGVSEAQLDEADECADRKEQMIRLVIAKESVGTGSEANRSSAQDSEARDPSRERKLRAELGLLKTSALRVRAMKAGVSEAELDDADDQDDCRSALVALIVARSQQPTAS